jgi:hypothetical protein
MASEKAAATVPDIISNVGNFFAKCYSLHSPSKVEVFFITWFASGIGEWGGVIGEANDKLHVKDVDKVDDDFVLDGVAIPEGDADDQDFSETKSEEGPNLSILDLYLKLFKLRANPLGLAHFFSGLGEGPN